jgi:hypothetical protein
MWVGSDNGGAGGGDVCGGGFKCRKEGVRWGKRGIGVGVSGLGLLECIIERNRDYAKRNLELFCDVPFKRHLFFAANKFLLFNLQRITE